MKEGTVFVLYQARNPDNSMTRLEMWPEGYVLWHEGEIVWKSFADNRTLEELRGHRDSVEQ